MDEKPDSLTIDVEPVASTDDQVTAALKTWLPRQAPTEGDKRTYADLLAQAILRAAIKGDVRAQVEIIRRVAPRNRETVYSEPTPLGSASENSERINRLLRKNPGDIK